MLCEMDRKLLIQGFTWGFMAVVLNSVRPSCERMWCTEWNSISGHKGGKKGGRGHSADAWSISVIPTCNRSLNLADVLTRSDKQLSIFACSAEPGLWLNNLEQSFCGWGGERKKKPNHFQAIREAGIPEKKTCQVVAQMWNVPQGSFSKLWYSHCTPPHYSESPETGREERPKVCNGREDSQRFPPVLSRCNWKPLSVSWFQFNSTNRLRGFLV